MSSAKSVESIVSPMKDLRDTRPKPTDTMAHQGKYAEATYHLGYSVFSSLLENFFLGTNNF